MFALSSACGVGSRIHSEEPLLPLLRREAVVGVARHDVARAERKAERVEARVDLAPELEQPVAMRGGFLGTVRGKQQRVVLVGRERLLTAPLAPEREPAPSDPAEIVPLQHEIDGPTRQRVVERGDRARKRLGADALREQVLRQPTDVLARPPQRLDRVGGMQLLDHLAHRHPLQREEIALVDHAERPAAVDDDDLPDPAVGHRVHRLVCGGGARQRHDWCRHHFGDRYRERALAQQDALEQVDQRDHAHRRARVVHNDDRAHLRVGHRLRRLAQCRRRRAGDRRVAHELHQRARQRLLLGGPLTVLAVEALERLLERLGDRLCAVAFELRRFAPQFQEILAREQVAERVLQRVEDLRRRPSRRQRADGKELSWPEHTVRVGLRVVRTAADDTALDDVQMTDRAALRGKDRRVLREVARA